ncbi:MAG: CDP-diglyceride synthetase CdsA [Candidatus Methanohalarchaeum thermophilum]|uniref:CDP-archaeol synthase n=1 Tax=Methanohalarchaeum thermophilum TaxID=1903181 RepID=A0A1Q6DS63_METT1|nr:MAG: CDP-diglyceride synthetase CdsA [Candidatus Methanohalarchaeum thermophilum]
MIGFFISALWLIIPAYLPNSTAVIFKGKKPIDFGKRFIDGRRILGNGKTFRGLIGGTLCGTTIGVFQILISGKLNLPDFNGDPLIVFTLALGAMLGDMAFSFIKRRLGLDRGAPFPLFDQLDFVFGALFLTYLVHGNWFKINFTLWKIIFILLVTPLIHLAVNYLGYKIGEKKEPW